MEHIEIKNSLDSKLQTYSICSIKILDILEVIAKTNFFKSRKMRNPVFRPVVNSWTGAGARRFFDRGVTSISDFRFLPQFEPVEDELPSFEFSSPLRRGLSERPLVRPIDRYVSLKWQTSFFDVFETPLYEARMIV